jgi:ABC-type transporter Mla subunit MlaD
MDNEKGYFRLGLFILVGAGLIVGGVILFSSGLFSEEGLIVETVSLESAQGLDVGAPVKFRGVRIGHVRKIELAYVRYRDKVVGAEQDIGNAVILELAVKPEGLPTASATENRKSFEQAVERGLRARIASSSLTGPPYVELVFLNPKTSPPLALPWKPENPYLPAGQSTFAQFIDAAQEIVESVREADVGKVIKQADKLLVKAEKIIDDIHLPEIGTEGLALVKDLRDTNRRIQEILKNPAIEAMLADLASASGSIKEITANPDLKKFISDLPEISSRLKKTIDSIDALTKDENIKKALANLSNATQGATDAMADIRRLARSANTLLMSQQQDITAIIKNFRSVAENAAAVTEDAKANPSRVLFGEPPARPKGEKR